MKTRLSLLFPFLLALAVAGCTTTGPSTEDEAGGTGATAARTRARSEALVIPAGTDMDVRLSTGLNSADNQAGDVFDGTLESPIVLGDRVAVPKGADVKGKVTKAVKSGRLKERAELWVTLTEISAKGKAYEVATSTTGHKEGSKAARNIIFIGGGSGAGAAIGGATGGGKGAGIGAAIGAGAGVATAMLTGKRDVKFPPETVLRFQLEQDLRVQP